MNFWGKTTQNEADHMVYEHNMQPVDGAIYTWQILWVHLHQHDSLHHPDSLPAAESFPMRYKSVWALHYCPFLGWQPRELKESNISEDKIQENEQLPFEPRWPGVTGQRSNVKAWCFYYAMEVHKRPLNNRRPSHSTLSRQFIWGDVCEGFFFFLRQMDISMPLMCDISFLFHFPIRHYCDI